MNAIQKQTSPQKKREFAPRRVIGIEGHGLTQIRALVDIPSVNAKKGDLGGFIEKESNLSHEGGTWVSRKAKATPAYSITPLYPGAPKSQIAPS